MMVPKRFFYCVSGFVLDFEPKAGELNKPRIIRKVFFGNEIICLERLASLSSGSLFMLLCLYLKKKNERRALAPSIPLFELKLENRWMIANSNFSKKSLPAPRLFIFSAHALY